MENFPSKPSCIVGLMSAVLILRKVSHNKYVFKLLMNKIYFSFLLVFCFLITSCSFSMKKKPTKVKNNLKKKYPSGPTERGDGSFIEVSEQYGLGDVTGVRFNAVDLNNDGYTDLVVMPSFYSEPRFFYWNQDLKKFKENRYSPFAKSMKASFLLFYDLDHDDIIDLVAGVLNQKTELTRYSVRIFKGSIINKRIWFTQLKDVLKAEPLPTSSISLLDFNLDGNLDIFQANWFRYGKGDKPWPVPDKLYLKTNKGYIDQSKLLFGELTKNETKENYIKATPSYSAATCDLDQNGFPDILVASTSGYPNKLWLNEYQLLGNKRLFKDYAKSSRFGMDLEGFHIPRGGGRSFFASCADYNNDGLMDVYVGEMTHSYDNDAVDRSSILTNISKNYPPKFMRTEYLGDSESFNWSRADKRANWVDLNLDGSLDLLVDNSGYPPYSRLVFFEQDNRHDFFDVAREKGINVLNPEGSIIMDINRDGKPDIISGQSNIRSANIKQKIYVYQNNYTAMGTKFLRIYPRGINANSSALGATVVLESMVNGKKLNRKMYVEYSQGGLPSQNEEGLFFAISKGEELIRIKVRWPVYQTSAGIGRSYLEKSYSLKNMKLVKNNQMTLCEDGRVFFKRKFCR
jgi:enediyne biosynthesis protein E4